MEFCQSAEGQVGAHTHSVHQHGVDAEGGGPVRGGDLLVLQLHEKGLE